MKLDDAANITANINVRGLASIEYAVVIATGINNATVAWFDITDVSSIVAPKNAATRALGPIAPNTSTIPSRYTY